MTRHLAAELGPLFAWCTGNDTPPVPVVPGTTGNVSERAELLADPGTGTESFPTIGNVRERISEIPSDSVRSRDVVPVFLSGRGDHGNDHGTPRVLCCAHAPQPEDGLEVPGASVPGMAPEGEVADRIPTLRPYQSEAIAAIERELATVRATLLVLPTGCGKTVVFAEHARRSVSRGGRCLVLAHREELLDQAARKLADVGVRAAVEQGDRRAHPNVVPVVVGSVQTLRGARLERFAADAFTDIIVDEAHHAAAKSYRNILERFPAARVLGVTATPDRGDGRALGKVFSSVAYTYDMRRAIREGFLAPLRAKRILVEELDLAAVKTHHGDFDQAELSKLLNDERNLLGVVDPLLREAGDRKTLVFGVDVAHAHALAEVINAKQPGAAIAVDGKASREERAAALDLFRRGAIRFLVNCALFTEGFDEPSIGCVALARPTQSRALYTQMLGRGTRLAPGKTECLVLDFVGNSGRHRIVGPADALAGTDLDDEVRKRVEAKLAEDGGDQLELEAVVAAAQAEVAAEKARRRAALNDVKLREYRAREVDLFLGDLMPTVDPDDPLAQQPATPNQLQAIIAAKLGVPPAGLSFAEAAAMLDAVAARRKSGLATIPQARMLEKLGVDTKAMPFKRANDLITLFMKHKGQIGDVVWKQPAIVFGQLPEFRRRKV